MSKIFRFNIPFTDKYFLINTSKKGKLLEQELFKIIEKWCIEKQLNLKLNCLETSIYFNEYLPSYLLKNLGEDASIKEVKLMLREN